MRLVQSACAAAMLAILTVGLADPSGAHWLSRLVREAGDAGGSAGLKAGRLGLGALDEAAAHVARLPRPSRGTALAAHVTPEGHWRFVGRDGDAFTAATPDELARARTTLAPEAAPGDPLALYLSADTVFQRRAHLAELPAGADLSVVVGGEAYRLRRAGAPADLAAEFRPGIAVRLADRRLFEETVYRLGRPLNRASIRVLALAPGGPQRLSTVPRYDPATRAALVDSVDPAALPAAFAGIRGQTALISGRIEGGVLVFRPAGGAEQAVDIARLVRAAGEADVNLVLLEASSARQPGGRNWLWQRISVAGLDEAMQRATFADFLTALGGAGELSVTARPGPQGRVVLSAVPAPGAAAPITDTLGGWIGEITGHVAVRAAEVHVRDAARERELDARIVPGIPATAQYLYLAALALGLIGWRVARAWWTRLWPPEERREYAGRVGYIAARAVRELAFLLLFLPVVGLPAALWTGFLALWALITAPFRGWSRLRGRSA